MNRLAFVGLLCAAVLFSTVSVAQDTPPEPTQPEPAKGVKLEGKLACVAMKNLTVRFEAYTGAARLKSIVAPGSMVKQGDVVAELELEDLARLRDEWTLSAAQAKRGLELARGRRQQFEDGLKHRRAALAAELAEAERDLKAFSTSGKADRIRNSEISLEWSRDSIADQEEELKQLDALYKGNELAKESQDIVLNRSRRRLERSRESLKMAERAHERLLKYELPGTEEKLTRAHAKAERDLADFDKARALDRLELELAEGKAAQGVAAWDKSLEKLVSDEQAASLRAPHAGHVVNGALEGNDGLSTPFRVGDKIAAGTTLAAVFDTARLRVTVMAPVDKLEDLKVGAKVVVGSPKLGASAQGVVAARSMLAKDGKVAVSVDVDNAQGLLMPGLDVLVTMSEK